MLSVDSQHKNQDFISFSTQILCGKESSSHPSIQNVLHPEIYFLCIPIEILISRLRIRNAWIKSIIFTQVQ